MFLWNFYPIELEIKDTTDTDTTRYPSYLDIHLGIDSEGRLTATLYLGNSDRNHKLWNIVSTERYIRHMQKLLECCYI
jgi:hypothetical protein